MQAVLLVVGAAVVMFAAAILAQAAGAAPMVSVGIAELALLALPVALARRRIGLRWPAGRFFAAAILVGASAWYVNSLVVSALFPDDAGRDLAKLVTDSPLPLAIVCAGMLPAIAEEIVFRGVLARSLATRLPLAAAIAISAAAFSVFHVNLVQAIPTFTIGLALAYIALRADSILPSMLAHAVNNLVAVALTRLAPSQDAPVQWNASVAAFAAVALGLTAGGLVLAGRGAA
jgi:membrane protease YdiL (CAAX protease family)